MNIIGRTIKYFMILVVLVLLGLLVFVATFDANHYKPQIIKQVESATGRDFNIDGEINLSIFPWVGLKVEQAVLGNAEGFAAPNFAAIEQLDISVNVMPLLKKEVQLSTIRLHGVDVSLEVAKQDINGQPNNWASLSQGKADDKAGADTAADKPAPKAEPAMPLASIMVEGFELVDARIHYADRKSGMEATVSSLNLVTSEIRFDEAVDVAFDAQIQVNQPVLDTGIKLETQLYLNQALTEFKLSPLALTVDARANDIIASDEAIKLDSDITISMDTQHVDVKQLTLAALGLELNAGLQVASFMQAPAIQGDIAVEEFNAYSLVERLNPGMGIVLPQMQRKDALNRIALKTAVSIKGQQLQANKLHLQLDDSALTGWVHVPDIAKQQLRYELVIDKINVNHYMPPAVAEMPETIASAPAGKPATGAAKSAQSAVATGNEKIELPLTLMRQLDVQGDFRIDALTALVYDIQQLDVGLKAGNGVIDIKPLSMQVLEGQVQATSRINVKKDIPAYTITSEVNQVQLGPVANPFLDGIMGDEPLTMKGAANLKASIKTSGDTVNKLKKAARGQIVLDMNETEVDGFDPEYFMRKSVADYLHGKGFGLSKTIMGSYKPREVTVFDTIHSTVNLKKGKARTDDFKMLSKRVHVGAAGHVDIMKNAADITSSIKLPRGKTAAEKLLSDPVYVRIHGPFTALEYDLDTKRLKQSTTDVLEKEARAKIDAEKRKLKKKAEAEKRRAKEKADKELKRKQDELENKLKDKFKGLF